MVLRGVFPFVPFHPIFILCERSSKLRRIAYQRSWKPVEVSFFFSVGPLPIDYLGLPGYEFFLAVD